MYNYAQIDAGICISVSYLSGEVDAPNMLPLSPADDVHPGDIYDGETWTRPEPSGPEPDRIAQLETENLELKLALAELAEAQQTDKLDVQLALAELAEIITGGNTLWRKFIMA